MATRERKLYTGARFGKLVIIECLGRGNGTNPKYKCRCDCGNEVVKVSSSLIKPDEPSCGCGRRPGQTTASPRLSDDHHIVANFKRHAVHKVAISDAEILRLRKSNCHYCGCAPTERAVANASNLRERRFAKVNGIDRLDSSKGYEPGNVVSCCHSCNTMKGTLSIGRFIDKVKSIASKF